MVSYALATQEQIELAETARKILEKSLAPRIEELEAADGGLGLYPMDVHQELADAGYYGMGVPEEYGGLGLDVVTQAIILEEMGKVDAGFAFSFAGSGCYFDRVRMMHISEEEKQELAADLLSGAMCSFNLTEPSAGSDPAAMRTTAVYDAATDEWVINGTKCFGSNAPCAKYFIVSAWTDKTKRPSQGITEFWVPKSLGVKIGKKENKMGLHLSETSDVIYEDVRVPSKYVIGEVGKGFGNALNGIKTASALVNCCPTLGTAQAALDQAIEYAKTRRQFGKRIIDHQGLGLIIADMMMRLESARAMLYEYLNCEVQGVDCHKLDLMIKPYITEQTFRVCDDAIQVLGGYGYMKDYPMERYMRNLRIFRIFGGTNQIKRKNLIKSVAGKDPEAKK